jgi:sarcosine oxidase gamma subunit
MEAIGLLVMLEARAGKEADAEAFLKSALPLALNEKATLKWYAIKLGPGKFGIFDTFANRKRLQLKGDWKWQTQRKQQLLQGPREESERASPKRS